MAVGYVANTSATAVPLVAATAKTVLNVISGADSPAFVVEFGISLDGVTASALPVLVEMCFSTQATAGTVRTSPVGVQIRGYPAYTSASAFGEGYTAEPTVLTIVKQWLVDPNKGLFVVQFPLGREPQGVITAATSGKGIAFRCTAPAAVNARAYVEIE